MTEVATPTTSASFWQRLEKPPRARTGGPRISATVIGSGQFEADLIRMLSREGMNVAKA